MNPIELQAVQATVPVERGTGDRIWPSPASSAAAGADFNAAMARAEARLARVVDVPPGAGAEGGLTPPAIGEGLLNMAKSFANLNTQMGADLKKVINANPMDPTFMMDLAAYHARGAINHLQFTVATKVTSQTSKHLDTLMRSS